LTEDILSRVPWGMEPSLKDKTEEVGIDFDRFIEGMKMNRNNMELAKEFGVSEKLIGHLREHFEKIGVHSIVGRD